MGEKKPWGVWVQPQGGLKGRSLWATTLNLLKLKISFQKVSNSQVNETSARGSNLKLENLKPVRTRKEGGRGRSFRIYFWLSLLDQFQCRGTVLVRLRQDADRRLLQDGRGGHFGGFVRDVRIRDPRFRGGEVFVLNVQVVGRHL